MKTGLATSDLIALASVLVAMVALVVSLYSAHVARDVATSGFQSAEKVKSDTAILIAALQGIIVKWALYTQADASTRDNRNHQDYIDMTPEKAVVQSFLNSPTATAYYNFAASKSRAAEASGKESEPWRVFFLELVMLLRSGSNNTVGRTAVRLLRRLDELEEPDLLAMSDGLGDLVGMIKRLSKDRRDDTLLSAAMAVVKDEI